MQNKNVNLASYLIVALAALYYLYMFLVRVLPTVMLKDLMQTFGASPVEIAWLSVSFFYAYALSQIPSGILIDRFGAKRVLVIGMAGCVLSGYLFQATSIFSLAIVSRMLLGMFSAPAFIAPMTLVKEYLPEHLFTPAAGFIQVLGCIGAMLIKPAARLLDQAGWQQAILSTVFFGLLLLFIYTQLPNDTPKDTIKERTSTYQALSEILRHLNFWVVGFLALSSWAAIGGFAEGWGVEYLSQLQGISVIQASSQMSWAWIGVAVASPLAGFWFEHTQHKMIPLISMYLFGLISVSILVFLPSTNPYLISALLFLLGTSAGAQPIAFKLVSKLSPDRIVATAVSFCNMCVIAGAFLVQPWVTYCIEYAHKGSEGHYTVSDFQVGFTPIIIIMMIAICLSYWIHQPGKLNEIS